MIYWSMSLSPRVILALLEIEANRSVLGMGGPVVTTLRKIDNLALAERKQKNADLKSRRCHLRLTARGRAVLLLVKGDMKRVQAVVAEGGEG